MPAKSARAKWAAVNATIIDPPDNFDAIRHALGKAIAEVWGNPVKAGK
jgi:hypothetical protein